MRFSVARRVLLANLVALQALRKTSENPPNFAPHDKPIVCSYISRMSNGFLARGKVVEAKDSIVVFQPADTNYQIHLQTARPYTGPIGQLIDARIRAKARKVYTVSSGGGFISPIFGSPRTLQGRALHVEDRQIIIRAGVAISVELPQPETAVDLSAGPIAVGSMINVAALPGTTFELVPSQTSK